MRLHTTIRRTTILLALLAGLIATVASAQRTTEAAAELQWHTDLDSALGAAKSNYQSVFVIFTSDGCAWCHRLKTQILPAPELRPLLQRFTLVEINISAQPEVGRYYQVRAVPAIMVMSANGGIRMRHTGIMDVPTLQKTLRGLLNLESSEIVSPEVSQLLETLDEPVVADEVWASVLAAVGSPSRDAIRAAVYKIRPQPRAALVQHLQHPRLAVRLGAIELLEEMAGTSHDFDPWLDSADPAANAAAIAAWQEWAGAESTRLTQIYTGLSEERLQSCLADLLADDRERNLRAQRILQNSDKGTDAFLTTYLKEHEDLPAEHVRRINDVRYSLRLPMINGIAPEILSHRLVFGSLDQRLEVLGMLNRAGKTALPIVEEQLTDANPMIRERAVEQTLEIGGSRAVKQVMEFLATEADTDIHYAAIRKMGESKSRRAYTAVKSYLTHEQEDMVIAALSSLQKIGKTTAIDELEALLTDSRWRVRVAALDTIKALRQKQLRDAVLARLEDEEPFVRYTAISTLAAIPSDDVYARLEEVYAADPSIRALILKAYAAMDREPTTAMIDALDEMTADDLVQALDAVAEMGKAGADIARRFVNHPSADIQILAFRILIGRGKMDEELKGLIAAKLKDGPREVKLGILESIRGSDDDDTVMENADKALVEELAAADGEDAGVVADLFAAFDDEETAKPAKTTKPKVPPADLSKQLDAAFATDDPELKLQAAVVAILTADETPTAMLDYVRAQLPESSASRRRDILSRLSGMPDQTAYTTLAIPYLVDPDEGVRNVLLWRLAQSKEGITAIIRATVAPDSPVEPWTATRSLSYTIDDHIRGEKEWGEILEPLFAATDRDALQIMGLFLLAKDWRSSHMARIDAAMKSTNPYLRRAAMDVLAQAAPQELAARAELIVSDPSPLVRIILPAAFHRRLDIPHLFDDKHSYSDSDWRSQGPRMDEATTAQVRKLLDDTDQRVRFEASLLLLTRRESIDLQKLAETVESFSDQASAGARIADFLEENYRNLGQEFVILVPYLKYGRYIRNEEAIYTHFGISRDEEDDLDLEVAMRRDGASYMATFDALPEVVATPADQAVQFVYFAQAGCDHCERVQEMLAKLQAEIPELTIETHDIRKNAGRLLNETLCQHFGVPDLHRMIAPSVFAGGGYLVTDEIDYGALRVLAERSRGVPRDAWYLQTEKARQASEERIEQRFSNLTLALVIANGFMDGINPCAFATIIFFLSYLRLTRRNRREIAQVSVAFIAGVFITYFLLGLGLMEVVARIHALKVAGAIMNWTVIGIAGVLMVMSAYDGVLCLRGRVQDSTLQLPTLLKERIRSAVRTGARHRRFVVAAFVVGCAISVLELACTGQVYLPTILFMIENGADSIGPYGYLTTYNLAFVLPLITIFFLAYFGMGSERLAEFFQRHVAWIKFGMAGVFLGLIVMFLLTR